MAIGGCPDVKSLVTKVSRSDELGRDFEVDAVVAMLARQGISTISAFKQLTTQDLDWAAGAESLPLGQRALLRAAWTQASEFKHSPSIHVTKELYHADVTCSWAWYYGGHAAETASWWVERGFSLDTDMEVRLVVDGQELLAHAEVLRYRSDVLRAELDSGMRETQLQHIELPDDIVTSRAVGESFLGFLYTGELKFEHSSGVSVQSVVELMNVLHYYNVDLTALQHQIHQVGFVRLWTSVADSCDLASLIRLIACIHQPEICHTLATSLEDKVFVWGETWLQALGWANLHRCHAVKKICLDGVEKRWRICNKTPGTCTEIGKKTVQKLTTEWQHEVSERNIRSIIREAGVTVCVQSIWQVSCALLQKEAKHNDWHLALGKAMSKLQEESHGVFEQMHALKEKSEAETL